MSTRTETSYYIVFVFDQKVYRSTKTQSFAMIHYDCHCPLCVFMTSHIITAVNVISLSLMMLSRSFVSLSLLLPDQVTQLTHIIEMIYVDTNRSTKINMATYTTSYLFQGALLLLYGFKQMEKSHLPW